MLRRIHHEAQYTFPVPGRPPGVCDLEVYSDHQGKVGVVVWTELEGNPGMSVTNAAEHLVLHVHRNLRTLLPDPQELYFLERYDHRSYAGGKEPERLALLKFQEGLDFALHHPSWHHLPGNLQEVLEGFQDQPQ